MPKSKVIVIGAAVAAASIALGAAALAKVMPPGYPVPPGMAASYALFVANMPQGSNRVGVFVARRMGGEASVFYCSSPADATAKDPSGCREIKGFPSK